MSMTLKPQTSRMANSQVRSRTIQGNSVESFSGEEPLWQVPTDFARLLFSMPCFLPFPHPVKALRVNCCGIDEELHPTVAAVRHHGRPGARGEGTLVFQRVVFSSIGL